jgi:uncharacterized phiE125 gp8 family phage protein
MPKEEKSMALQLLTPPVVEPVSLPEVKAHLRIDVADEDALLGSLIVTSRLQIEAALALALNSQSWRLTLDCWPLGGTVEIPIRPLQSANGIRVRDLAEMAVTVDPFAYAIDVASDIGRIAPRSGYWPQPGIRQNGIEIDFVAGFGPAPADVPALIRQALLMLIAHWYENREPAAVGSPAARIPDDVSALLAPYVVRKI